MPGKCIRRNPGWRVPTVSISVLALMTAAGFLCGRIAEAQEVAMVRLVPLLSAKETVAGEPIRYPGQQPARVTAAVVTLAPGAETGWHTHGAPTFGYILEGEVSVDYGAQGVRVFKAGEGVMEAIAVAHNGRNTGTGPVRILAVTMGAEGLAPSSPVPR